MLARGQTRASFGQNAPLTGYSNFSHAESTNVFFVGMNVILADALELLLKTKRCQWHMRERHFRDHQLLIDEQAEQLYAMTDLITEHIRKNGGSTLRSFGRIARDRLVAGNDAEYVDPFDMLAELRGDNQGLATRLRELHKIVDAKRDVASASLIEGWIHEAQRRIWFLYESGRSVD
jgi:starvation-inducible DNA-binding protein